MQLAGVNPYRYRPYEHALDRVRYSGRGLINHDELQTIYPPLVAGGLPRRRRASTTRPGWSDAVTPRAEVILFKLVFGAFDLATAAAVWFLAARKLRLQATVLYLLCPAVIVQTWESAHAEAAATSASACSPPRCSCAAATAGPASRSGSPPPSRSRRSGCSCRRCWAGGPRPPASSPASSRRFVLPYVPVPAHRRLASARCSRAGPAGPAARSCSPLLALLTTPEVARWLALALFIGGALWIAGSFRGREKHRRGLRLDVHAADLLPARGPRLVLAHAAGAGTRRRPLAAAADRHGRAARRVAAAGATGWHARGALAATGGAVESTASCCRSAGARHTEAMTAADRTR